MNLVKLLLAATVGFVLPACAVDKSDQSFSFPGNAVGSAPTPLPISTTPSINLLNSVVLGYATMGAGSGLSANHIVFDGTYLVVPAIVTTNTINFEIINTTSFTYTTSYQSTAAGVTSIHAAASNGAGTIYVVWSNGSGTKYLSSWPTVNPTTPISTITFNPTVYGCSSSINGGIFRIAYLSSTFYGACQAANSNLRLFSFDSNGNVLSSVTQAWPTSSMGSLGSGVLGLAVVSGNLTLATSYGTAPWGMSIYKYNTSLQYQGEIGGSTGSLTYTQVQSITSDGSSLYIGNGYESCSGYAACYRFSKTTKGNL